MYSTQNIGKTVLVAMTGRTDSAVAAYLLRKQGYSPIGIGLQFYDANDVKEYGADFLSSYHIDDLEVVSKVCKGLEVPFYAVNAVEVFKANVLDKAVAARLAGQAFNIQSVVTSIIINTLISKMKTLKGHCIATGHYARIQFNKMTGEFALISANEIEADQSFALASLGQRELSKLILPLSDIRLNEVEKISGTMGVKVCPNDRALGRTERFFYTKSFIKYVEKHSPKSLHKKGPIIDIIQDSFCADHSGIHNHYIGEKEVRTEYTSIDSKLCIVQIDAPRGIIYVAPASGHVLKHCAIKDVIMNKKQDVSIPVSAYVQFGVESVRHKCNVFFKNNGALLIELNDPSSDIIAPGSFAVIYSKIGAGAKIIGAGVVRISGDIGLIKRIDDQKERDAIMDEASDKKKTEEKYMSF